jgi:hypothetical protein
MHAIHAGTRKNDNGLHNTAINDSVNGRSGKNVYGQDVNTVHHRIINVRVKNGKVEGRSLSSGKRFLLAGWDAR